MNYREEYERWLVKADDEMKELLRGYSDKEIEDSFYRNLAFGTGGLRGTIGAGTNRMNIHTVWSYLFDDGTQLKLLDTGFSMQEIVELEKLHGKCVVSHERIRW